MVVTSYMFSLINSLLRGLFLVAHAFNVHCHFVFDDDDAYHCAFIQIMSFYLKCTSADRTYQLL